MRYCRARYYHPTLQRFVSEDPIGFAGGFNLYNYVDNSPPNRVDPLGYAQRGQQNISVTHGGQELNKRTPIQQVEKALEEAIERALLSETRQRRAPSYAFTHALVRQTLYEEMTMPRKQKLHLRAAQAIEAVHGRNLDPQVAALAIHYRTAGAAADHTHGSRRASRRHPHSREA